MSLTSIFGSSDENGSWKTNWILLLIFLSLAFFLKLMVCFLATSSRAASAMSLTSSSFASFLPLFLRPSASLRASAHTRFAFSSRIPHSGVLTRRSTPSSILMAMSTVIFPSPVPRRSSKTSVKRLTTS